MRYWLLDLLACPVDKQFPLELLRSKDIKTDYNLTLPEDRIPCELYCSLHEKKICSDDTSQELQCGECINKDVLEATLLCPNCGKSFEIINGIPKMFSPQEINNKKVLIPQYGKLPRWNFGIGNTRRDTSRHRRIITRQKFSQRKPVETDISHVINIFFHYCERK